MDNPLFFNFLFFFIDRVTSYLYYITTMLKRITFISLGVLSTVFGVLGIILPLLPTTPFLLLASILFLKSSPKLYNFLMNNRILGLHLRGYLDYKAIKIQAKISSLILLWFCIGITIIFVIPILWLRIALLVVALSVSIHLLTIKTMTKAQEELIKEEISR